MNIKFVLREDKADRNGRMPVFVHAYFDGQRLQCFTKEKCLPTDWNKEKGQFRRSFGGYQDANDCLQDIAERLQKHYLYIPI